MAIPMTQKQVNNEDNSFLGQLAKPMGLVGGLAALAAPFTAGTSLAVPAAATAAGANVVSTADQMNKEANVEAPPKQNMGIQPQDSSAMQRRYESMTNSPTHQIAEASNALGKMPEDIQNEYKPLLSSAQMKIKRIV